MRFQGEGKIEREFSQENEKMEKKEKEKEKEKESSSNPMEYFLLRNGKKMAKGNRKRGFLWFLRRLKYGIRNHVCISRGNYFLLLPLFILNSKNNHNYGIFVVCVYLRLSYSLCLTSYHYTLVYNFMCW